MPVGMFPAFQILSCLCDRVFMMLDAITNVFHLSETLYNQSCGPDEVGGGRHVEGGDWDTHPVSAWRRSHPSGGGDPEWPVGNVRCVTDSGNGRDGGVGVEPGYRTGSGQTQTLARQLTRRIPAPKNRTNGIGIPFYRWGVRAAGKMAALRCGLVRISGGSGGGRGGRCGGGGSRCCGWLCRRLCWIRSGTQADGRALWRCRAGCAGAT